MQGGWHSGGQEGLRILPAAPVLPPGWRRRRVCVRKGGLRLPDGAGPGVGAGAGRGYSEGPASQLSCPAILSALQTAPLPPRERRGLREKAEGRERRGREGRGGGFV